MSAPTVFRLLALGANGVVVEDKRYDTRKAAELRARELRETQAGLDLQLFALVTRWTPPTTYTEERYDAA